ncbi:MAG: class B sortase [Blautia sp.]|jgi:sortase B
MKHQEKRKKTLSDYLLTFLLVIAIGVFLYAAFQLFSIYSEYKKGVDEYNKLEEIAVSENPNKKKEEQQTEEEKKKAEPPITVDFEELRKINPDVVGWIYIEGIDISYPVVQGSDNEEYLHHTYEGTYNFAGSIFLEHTNKSDFSDCNTIVYGHNMKNGSMFGTLKYFTEKDAYAKSPYIWILTPDGNYRYEIFAAYVTPVNSDTYTLFKGPGKEFQSYMKEMKGNSEIQTRDMEMDVKDKVITLSTCTGNSSTRYVVQGVRLKE